MDYCKTIQYLENLSPTLVKPGLARFALFMKEEGSRQDRCPAIHVAGTNGKGSVTSMLANTLHLSGLKTGKYTGPHIFSFNERFVVQGKNVSNTELAEICSGLKLKSEDFARRHPEHGQLTWFEILTALAFEYFEREKTDVSVFETGLGGRYDATNVLASPAVTAIVTVSLDHTHLLGKTESKIALEKAGILKTGVPLVTACKNAALDMILRKAEAKNVPVICLDAGKGLFCPQKSSRAQSYKRALEARFAGLNPPLASTLDAQSGYQRLNAQVAAAVLGIFELESGRQCLDNFAGALSSFFWPGRMQYFREQNLILDAAHNIDGARALRSSLDELFPNKARCFVLSFYQSKMFEKIMAALLQPQDLVFASQTTGRRPVVPSGEIVRRAQALKVESQAFPGLNEAFQAASQLGERVSIRVGSGSFATVAAGLRFLGYDNTEDSQSASSTL